MELAGIAIRPAREAFAPVVRGRNPMGGETREVHLHRDDLLVDVRPEHELAAGVRCGMDAEEPVGSARAPDGTALADPEPHIHVLRVPEDGAEAADALVGLALDDGSRVLEELLGGLDAEEVFEEPDEEKD